MGGLQAMPKISPVSTAPFLELASDPAMMSWVDIGPTMVLGRRRVRLCIRVVFGVSR